MSLFNLAHKRFALKLAMPEPEKFVGYPRQYEPQEDPEDANVHYDNESLQIVPQRRQRRAILPTKSPVRIEDADVANVHLTQPEREADRHERLGDSAQFQDAAESTASMDAAAKKKMKDWIVAQYEADHGGAPNPQFPDPTWFLDEATGYERPPISIFWKAAEVLKNKINSHRDWDTYVLKLVEMGKSQTTQRQPRSKSETPRVMPIGNVNNLQERFPFYNAFLDTLAPDLTHAFQKTYRNKAEQYADGLQNGLLTAFSVAAKGRRRDLDFFIERGWEFLPEEVKEDINQKTQLDLNSSSERYRLANDGRLKEVLKLLKRHEGAIHERLQALFALCADPFKQRKLFNMGLGLAPDIAAMEGPRQHEVIEKFRKAARSYAWDNILEKMKSIIGWDIGHQKPPKGPDVLEEPDTGPDRFGEGGITPAPPKRVITRTPPSSRPSVREMQPRSGHSEQPQESAPAPSASSGQDAEDALQQEHRQAVDHQIDEVVLPMLRSQLTAAATDIRSLGAVIGNYMRFERTDAEPEPKYDLDGKMEYQKRPSHVPFGKQTGAYFKAYSDELAKRLDMLAGQTGRTALEFVIKRYAHDNKLLEDGAYTPSNDPVAASTLNREGKHDKLLRYKAEGAPALTTDTLGAQPEGVAQLQQHGTFAPLWNASQPVEEKETFEGMHGTFQLMGRSALVRQLDLANLVNNTEFRELLYGGQVTKTVNKASNDKPPYLPGVRKGWPYIGTHTKRPAKGTEKPIQVFPPSKVFSEVSKFLSQQFPRWSNVLVLPEVMKRTTPVARQIIMDALTIRDIYRNGTSDHTLKYFYAGTLGIANAPAMIGPSDKARRYTPMMAMQKIIKWQAEGEANPYVKFLRKRLLKAVCDESRLIVLAGRMQKLASVDNGSIQTLLAQVRAKSAQLRAALRF